MTSNNQTTAAISNLTIQLPITGQLRPDFDADRETLDEDPHNPRSVAESFGRLRANVFALDETLQVLLDASRQLGRSYDLVVAAQALRGKLDGFLRLFYQNARQLSLLVEDPGQIMAPFSRDKVNEELFPDQLESVAAAFKILRDRLNEFREYTDESVNIKHLMESFAKHLNYRAMCFRERAGQFSSPHIQKYVHNVANELSHDLDEIAISFKIFNKYGIPSIRYEQKRDSEYDLNMSTMSTFFSAVTATMLQAVLSSQSKTAIHSIVTTFWFCSLVLSIGAALNSLLKRTTYGTHGRRLLPWVTIWMHGSAPLFLTLSITCFSAGLVLFTYVSNQKRYTSILTLVCTAVITFDLVSVSGWIVYQQWISPIIYPQSRSTKFEKDNPKKLSEATLENYPYNVLPVFTRAQTMLGSGIRSGIRSLSTTLDSVMQNQTHDLENASVPVQQAPHSDDEQPSVSFRAMATIAHVATEMLRRTPIRTASRARAPRSPISPASRTATSPFSLVFPNQPQHVLGYLLGEVRDLEYSHETLVLAVASFDPASRYSTTVLYNEKETHIDLTSHHRHRQGKVIKQVAWSPCDNMLLVRLDDTIDLLNTTPNLEHEWTIRRPHLVRSAAWCTSSDILFVEGGFVVRLSLDGHVTFKHHFENFLPRDVVVVPNTELLLLVGRITFKDMPLPKGSQAESQLKLFDMKHSRVCDSVPVLDDMLHITVADNPSSGQDAFDVLVGYKNERSPQLWKLTLDQNTSHQLQPTSNHLQPFNEFRGPGYFVGPVPQMISCVANDGSIHIWGRKSGATIHHIPAEVRVVEGSRRAVAWSAPQADVVRFASAGLKELRFWSTPPANSVLASPSRPRPRPPALTILGGPPALAVPNLDSLEESRHPAHSAVDMYLREIGPAIAKGQDLDAEKTVIGMNGCSEKAE